jgi:hypothetical protein
VAGSTVNDDTLQPRAMTAALTRGAGDGCRPDTGAVDHGGVLATLGEFFGRVSATQVYQGSATGQRLVGRLLPRATYAACVAIDANPWTKHDIGGSYIEFMRRLPNLSGLGL